MGWQGIPPGEAHILRSMSQTADRAHAPGIKPQPRWKVWGARLVVAATPLRSRRVRRSFMAARARRLRARRRRRETRGDLSLSRPAMYEMDVALERHLDLDGGFFVEAGANDGYSQSNTYWFERVRGWRGVLVEPVPDLYRLAAAERPGSHVVNCALVSREYEGDSVRMRFAGLMSLVEGAQGSPAADREHLAAAFLLGPGESYEVDVPARTLSSILDEVDAPEVDLLSLDVEGYEPQVLEGLDMDRHAPRFVLVEIRDMATGRPRVEAVLGERYRPVEALSPYDMLYARR
jgi:FkbM family methyltransferase